MAVVMLGQFPACIRDTSDLRRAEESGRGGAEGDGRLTQRSASSCEPWDPVREYEAGDEITYAEPGEDPKAYVANRFVFQNTPPADWQGDWFWSQIDDSECDDGSHPDLEAFLDELTPEGRQIAESFTVPLSDPDAQALAHQFVDEFTSQLAAGAYQPHLDANSDALNSLTGALSVGANGQLSVSVPLPVIPGREGLTPKLALNYTSGGASGALGVGWALSTPPSIHICEAWQSQRAHPAQDMIDARVTVAEAKTRLCYGGSPMVPVDDIGSELGLIHFTHRSGDGAVYRTVPDTGVKIERGTRGDPDSPDPGFIVHTGSGVQIGYQKSIHADEDDVEAWWAPTFFRDAHGSIDPTLPGHSMAYVWREQSRMPDSISYLDDRRRIEFEYEPHPNPRTIRGAGGPERIHELLDEIRVFSEGELIWTYDLIYGDPQHATGRFVLRTLRACAANGECMPDMSFEYADLESSTAEKFVLERNSEIELEDIPGSVQGLGDDYEEILENAVEKASHFSVLDLDGNGVDDVAWKHEDEFRYVLANNTGETDGLSLTWSQVRTFTIPSGGALDNDDYPISVQSIAARAGHGGRDLVATQNGKTVRFGLPPVDGYHGEIVIAPQFNHRVVRFLDANGDGLEDLVTCRYDPDDDAWYWGLVPARTTTTGFASIDFADEISDGRTCHEVHDQPMTVVRGQLPVPPWLRGASSWISATGKEPFPWTVSQPRAQVLVIDTGEREDLDSNGVPDTAKLMFTNGALTIEPITVNIVQLGEAAFLDRMGKFDPSTSCPPGEVRCDDGYCTTLDSDADNCGVCGNSCRQGTVCSEGLCKDECDDGLDKCLTECVDKQSNEDHCGSCTSRCRAGWVCDDGRCRDAEFHDSVLGDFNGDGVEDRYFENAIRQAVIRHRLHPVSTLATLDPDSAGFGEEQFVHTPSFTDGFDASHPWDSSYHRVFDYDEDGISDVLRPERGGCESGLERWAWQRMGTLGSDEGEPETHVLEFVTDFDTLGGTDYIRSSRIRYRSC